MFSFTNPKIDLSNITDHMLTSAKVEHFIIHNGYETGHCQRYNKIDKDCLCYVIKDF